MLDHCLHSARHMLRAIAAGAALLLFAALSAAAGEAPHMVVDPFWPKPLPNNWILGQVSGVAVDAQDHVWIIHRPRTLTADEKGAALDPPRSKCCIPAPAVIEFDPAGNVVQAWGGPGEGYEWPANEHGIYIDDKGFVWIGGNGPEDGQILKFTHDGKFVLQIGHEGPSKGSNDTSQLGRPADTTVDPSTNELYVADGYGNHRVIVFDAETGAYKRHWGAYGKPPTDEKLPAYDPKAPPSAQFANPVHCVKLAKDGLLYVCDRMNNRIQIFHKDGSFVGEHFYVKDTLGNGGVWDVALSVDPQQTLLFNADGENNEVRILRRADGTVLGAFGRSGRYAGQFHWVHNLAIDSHGDVFTTEVDNGKRVQRFHPEP
jgi:DNA-binding beta-propeller fold protein YncE